MGLYDIVFTVVLNLAALTCLAMAGGVLLQRRPGRSKWSFAGGMVAFAAENVATWVLVTQSELAEDRYLWLHVVQIIRLVAMPLWVLFVGSLLCPREDRLPTGWRFAVLGASAAAVAGAAATVWMPAFTVAEVTGPFLAARLDVLGRYMVCGELLLTVVILGGLENALRGAHKDTRWRIKYMILGLGGVFLVRFYFLAQLLLYHVLFAVFLPAQAASLIIGNVAILAALLRHRDFGMEFSFSRHILYRSTLLGVLGLYLAVLGVSGWVLDRLGVAEQLFWGSVVVFISALALAAVLLSEDVRWRLKRFIGLHFYQSKYDYREQWVAFTRRLGSLVTLDDLVPQLVAAVTDVVGAKRAALYLADGGDGQFHLMVNTGFRGAPATLSPTSPVMASLQAQTAPIAAEDFAPAVSPLADALPLLADVAVLVPLRWRAVLTGVMLIGPERTNEAYTSEDLDFLATVGQQAAGVITTARLTETLARAREFEAFHRFTSFVIHDLKNSISALSMLSQNAEQHFDDPEFQRDATRTLGRTVDRMKRLLAKLSSAPETATARSEPLDLVAIAREAIRPLAGHQRVRLVEDLAPLPSVSGDPEAVLQVVQNLVTNAVEALDGVGTVTVRTYAEGPHAVVEVADTGCGIPEKFLRESLFAPFRSTKKGGWGVGLYQARSVAEAHGGQITVASKEGEGTTFWLKVPCEHDPDPTSRSDTEAPR